MIGVDYRSVNVDLAGGESQTDEFKRLNPRGQVPVLVDGEVTIWDSMAILTYLAKRYGAKNWFPDDDLALTSVMQWLALSENELLYGLARARATLIFNRPFDLKQCQEDGHSGLTTMEQQLSTNKWLATESISIADIACYPYVSLAHEGEVSLDAYPHVQRWMSDVESQSGWIAI